MDHNKHLDASAQGGESSDLAWQGRLTVGDHWARWVGRAGDATSHRHFAAQAIQAPGGARLHLGPGEVVEGELILIDPLVAHRLEAIEGLTLHFLEPAAATDPVLADALGIFRAGRDIVVASHPTTPFWDRWRRGEALVRPRGDVLSASLGRIDARLGDGALRLRTIAEESELSPSRFRHLFAEEVGLPFRRYVLWRRLRLAVTEMGAGADATTAAHAAGFADLAHFSRTLKAMFGVTATQALRSREPARESGPVR